MAPLLRKNMAAKRGIALIVVLALLAMIVIMSVSFVVFMRAERSASRDYAEFVKARNIAQAGITRALVRMQQEMNATNQFYHGGAIYMTGTGETCSNWLPDAYAYLDHYVPNYGPFNTALNEARTGSRCKWTNMTVKGISGNNVLAGRYSFMVFDLSDMLDINTISNLTRNAGNSPEEVAMPPDDVKNGASLKSMRQQHRFESLCEVNLRNRTTPNFNTTTEYQPKHLVTFSYAPVDTFWNNTQQSARYFIGTNATQIQAQQGNITAVANALGLDTSFYNNLYDFANSTTDVPTNPNQMGGGKLVPMLYDFIVTNDVRQVAVAGGGGGGSTLYWRNTVSLIFETWYPFLVNAGKQYHIQLSALPVLDSVVAVPALVTPWTPVTVPALVGTPAFGTPTNSFSSNVFTFVWQTPVTSNTLTSVITKIKWTAAPTIYVKNAAGTTVDQMPLPQAIASAALANSITFTKPANAQAPPQGWGVNDPRINWRNTDWQTITTSVPLDSTTMGKKNSRYNGVDAYWDGSDFMYAPLPGKPGLSCLGDLGYLLYDASKPWHTVRMLGPDAADPRKTRQLFSRLCIATNRPQGYVNPNSQDAGALMCAFWSALKERYPNETGATRITQAEATAVANRLIALGLKSGRGNAYTNIHDVCRMTSNDLASAFTTTKDRDPWAQKGIMRNSIGLLNPRQNYWLVLVCAQAVKEVKMPQVGTYDPLKGDFVTAEVQCLACIWRDPYEDQNDNQHAAGNRRHKMFMQFFKWL